MNEEAEKTKIDKQKYVNAILLAYNSKNVNVKFILPLSIAKFCVSYFYIKLSINLNYC